MQAILALEDGRIFRGEGYGAKGECYGEVVFNTSFTGYQEIFTDPSYAGQIVVLTNPQIGNYGTNSADNEANKPLYRRPGHARVFAHQFQLALSAGCRRISRALQRSCHRRDRYPRSGSPSAHAWRDARRHLLDRDGSRTSSCTRRARIRKMDGTDLAKVVSTKARYEWDQDGRDPLLRALTERRRLRLPAT